MTGPMIRPASIAVLLGAAALAACNWYDKNTVQNIAGPVPAGARVKFLNYGVNSPGVNFYADTQKLTAISSATGQESTLGVTYGGQPLMRRLRQNGPGNQNRIEIWYLLAPPSGTATVVATLSNPSHEVHGSVSFTGVNQSQPFGESASASGQSTTASVNVSDTSSNQVVFSVIAANEGANPIIVTGGQTAAWNNGSGTTSSDILGAAATAPANESVPVSYALATSQPWALGAVALMPAAIRVRWSH